MRESPAEKTRKRARLLNATGKLTKRDGFAATGVDALMATVGKTAGGFYSRFESKDAFFSALIEHELERSLSHLSMTDATQAKKKFARYLSKAHVNDPQAGCVLPALTAEVARNTPQTRQRFEHGVEQAIRQIDEAVDNRPMAWSLLAQIVGGVMLARALESDQAKEELLDSLRAAVEAQIDSSSTA